MSIGCRMKWRAGKLVYHEEGGKVLFCENGGHSEQRAFNVISDDLGINGVRCPVDGKTYTSKSQYYAAVKASGREILGNEKPKAYKPQYHDIDWGNAIKETLEGRR